jgi:hypothetical protein
MSAPTRKTLEDFNAERPKTVDLPAPTAWPLVVSFGATLLAASLVTHLALGVAGALLLIVGCVGWFRDVLPHERHETVPVEPVVEFPTSIREQVARLDVGQVKHRLRLPVETHPVSAGIKGGIAGSVAMAVLASLYGVLVQRSLWYPINLLAAGVSAEMARRPPSALRGFSLEGLLLGIVIHGFTSLMVGLLYGVMLPMFPRRPILLGGVIAPLMWTGLLRATLGVVNPTLDALIDWRWFVASQIAFGIVAGAVVTRTAMVKTMQFAPLAVRAGLAGQGSAFKGEGEE